MIGLSAQVEKLHSHSLQLTRLLKKFQKNQNHCTHWRLHQAITSAQMIVNLSFEISHLYAYSLSQEEYQFFCDFIICGSEMAEYLAEHKLVKKSMRNHARYWLNLVRKFKPLLQGAIKQTQMRRKGASVAIGADACNNEKKPLS